MHLIRRSLGYRDQEHLGIQGKLAGIPAPYLGLSHERIVTLVVFDESDQVL